MPKYHAGQGGRRKENTDLPNTPSPSPKKKPTCMGGIAAMVDLRERKGLCTKQDL